MHSYVFERHGSVYGADLDTLEDFVSVQIAAGAKISFGLETARAFRDAYAKKHSIEPDLVGVEYWSAFEDDNEYARFTLIYFPDVDGGALLHAGTTDSAGLMLWQHGFEPCDEVPAAADPKILTAAYNAARSKLVRG